jgi:hypothetical protein
MANGCPGIENRLWNHYYSWVLIESEDEGLFWDFQCNDDQLEICEECLRRKRLNLNFIGSDLGGDKIVGSIEMIGAPGKKYADS